MSPVWISNFVTSPFRNVPMSPSQFHQFHARSFEASGCLSKLMCLIARAVLKWLPLELNFKENVTPQTSVKWGEKFYVSRKSFCRVQVHSTCRLLHFRLFIVYEECQRLLPRREFPGLPGLSGFLQLSCSLSLSDSSRNSLLSFFWWLPKILKSTHVCCVSVSCSKWNHLEIYGIWVLLDHTKESKSRKARESKP